MELVNLTPHNVGICDAEGNLVSTIPSSGIARASQTDKNVGEVESNGIVIPVITTEFGGLVDLPEATEGVAYIVSVITVSAAKAQGRTTSDLYTVGQTVRSPEGQIIGARALVRN
jgi:hypothetical protein